MAFYDQICVFCLSVSHHLVGGTYGLVGIPDLYLQFGGVLTETTVMECGLNFILPLVFNNWFYCR